VQVLIRLVGIRGGPGLERERRSQPLRLVLRANYASFGVSAQTMVLLPLQRRD